MGRKHIVPYGLYVPYLHQRQASQQTGFGEPISRICSKVWVRCSSMIDRQRGEMSSAWHCVQHGSAFGNAHAHALFDRVKVHERYGTSFSNPAAIAQQLSPARRFRTMNHVITTTFLNRSRWSELF